MQLRYVKQETGSIRECRKASRHYSYAFGSRRQPHPVPRGPVSTRAAWQCPLPPLLPLRSAVPERPCGNGRSVARAATPRSSGRSEAPAGDWRPSLLSCGNTSQDAHGGQGGHQDQGTLAWPRPHAPRRAVKGGAWQSKTHRRPGVDAGQATMAHADLTPGADLRVGSRLGGCLPLASQGQLVRAADSGEPLAESLSAVQVVVRAGGVEMRAARRRIGMAACRVCRAWA